MHDAAPFADTLTGAEANELLEQLALLGATGAPLAEGLRATATEAPPTRLTRVMKQLANKLDEGNSLEQVLSQSQGWLPPHIAGLTTAAVRTGSWHSALIDLVDHQQVTREQRQNVWSALVYPLAVCVLTSGLLLFLLFGITPLFEKMFLDFGMSYPLLTKIVFWWRQRGVALLLLLAICLLVAGLLYRKLAGPVHGSRWKLSMPVLGALWYWNALSDWAGLMAVLLHYRMQLPEALRLSARGIPHAYVSALSLRLAEGIEKGATLSQMLPQFPAFPQSLIPLFAWGERNDTLADALRGCRDLLGRRIELRAGVLRAILPPLALLLIGSTILLFVGGLFMPLATLISSLSG